MLWLACSTNEEEASQAIRAAVNNPAATPGSVLATVQSQSQRIGAGYNEEKAQALFALLAQKGVRITPTLVAQRAAGLLGDAAFTADARLKYMPAFLKQTWNPQVDFRFKNLSAEERANIGSAFQRLLELVGALHRAGVPLLVGTDAQSPYCFHGFSLHDELGLLVKAGLTPLEALQAATRNAAKFAGQLATLGTIESGKLADLVLLEADPLVEISHTQKIAAVVVGGKLIDKAGLQKLLADAEAAAKAQ